MTQNSSRLAWPYPSKDESPYFDSFKAMVDAQDATAYANREDRSVLTTNGGTFSWDSEGETLSWSAAIQIYSPISGYHLDIASGSVSITNGQFFYTSLTRAPTGNGSVVAAVASSVPNTDDAYAIAVVVDDIVIFRNGVALVSGTPAAVFAGGGSGGGGGAVIFDDSSPTAKSNIRSARAANQSPIDNTASQITNLGSQDGTFNGDASGATGIGSTIGGGDDNTATGNYSTVPGGSGNSATDVNAYAEGEGTTAGAEAAHSEGVFTIASGIYSHAEGEITTASGEAAHSEGYETKAGGLGASAAGLLSRAPRDGQRAWSGILGASNLRGQRSLMTFAGSIIGGGSGQTVELLAGDFEGSFYTPQKLILDDGHAYMIVLSGILQLNVASSYTVRSFKQSFLVRRESGLSTLVGSGTPEVLGDGSTSSWTLVGSIGTSPDRFKLVASNGSTTSAIFVFAQLEIIEIFNVTY